MNIDPIQRNISYDELLQRVQALLADENNPMANMANLASLLYWSLADVNWVGFYLRRGDELVLGPFQGKPACVRIAMGKGVCGSAALLGETVAVDDVEKFPGHIVCDPDSRSEIVVPMLLAGCAIGVLDVDSGVTRRFGEAERRFFQECVGILLDASAGWEGV